MRRTLFIFCLGILCAYYYLQLVAPCAVECSAEHLYILDHTATSPIRYRVLSAYMVEPFAGDHSLLEIGRAYFIGHLVFFPVMMLALYAWLRVWLRESDSLAGVLLVAALMPVMLQVWGLSLYTVVEVVILCVGLLLLVRKPPGWALALALLVVVGALNRETAVLLPLAFATTQFRRLPMKSYLALLAAFGGLFALVFGGLRLVLGPAPDSVPVALAWALNTGGEWWTYEAISKNLFFIPIWLCYALAFRRADSFLKRLLPVALVYLVLFLIFALWNEVRLHLPLLVLMLPVALLALREKLPTTRAEARAQTS